MRIGLVDGDRTDWRNRHLMLSSAYYKSQGHEVIFPYDPRVHGAVDLVRISSVFIRNRYKIFSWLDAFGVQYDRTQDPLFIDMELPEWIKIGGTAWNIHKKAEPELEACQPDYGLYDHVLGPADYVQGFLTRGCPRGCHFCVVPTMSGDKANPISTFADLLAGNPGAKYVRLMDDNFLAGPKDFVRSQFEWMIDQNRTRSVKRKLKFCLTQGADIRFMNEEWADYIARSEFTDVTNTHRMITFAFDSPKIEKQYRRGFEMLMDAGRRIQRNGRPSLQPSHVASFVLTGFDSTIEEDMRRVAVLRELGAYPYVMVYEPIHGEGIPEFYVHNPDVLAVYGEHLTIEERYFRHWKRCKHLQRYTNMRAIWKTVPNFDDYDGWVNQLRRWDEEDRKGIRRCDLPQAKHKVRWGEEFTVASESRTLAPR